jgi:hypothetical protein
MVVLTEFWLILLVSLEVAVIREQPPKSGLLDFLVILLLEELVREELHGGNQHQLSLLWTAVKSSNWAVGWERDWATRQKSLGWLSNVDCATVRVHKLQTSVFVSICKLVFGISVFLGVLSRFVGVVFGSCFALSSLHQFIVEAAIANKGFLWVKILMERLPNYSIRVDTDSYLL